MSDTAQAQQAAVTPAAIPAMTATVPVVFVIPPKPGESVRGDTMNVEVRLSDNPRRIPLVKCMIGPQESEDTVWSASAWIAAFAAARETKHRMLEYEYRIVAPETIDGPSAGMLLSASMLALIEGAPVLPGRTITGTISPDGTIGPVSDITSKLSAAKKAGFTKFGFPVGQRLEFSKDDNKYVDLVERGQDLGISAVELRDINDAFFLLTDKTTGREVQTIPATPPSLSQEAVTKVHNGYRVMESKLKNKIEEMRHASKTVRIPSNDLRNEMAGDEERLSEIRSEADALHAAGSISAAYFKLLSASLLCDSLQNEFKVFGEMAAETTPKKKISGAVATLLDLREGVDTASDSLETIIKSGLSSSFLVPRLESLNAYINMREAAAYALSGDSLANSAMVQAKALNKPNLVPDGFLECLSQACLYYAQAKTEFESSRDFYGSLGPRIAEQEIKLSLPPEFEHSIGGAYGQGAKASQAFLDAFWRPKWKEKIVEQFGTRMAAGYEPNFQDRIESISLLDTSYLPNQWAAQFNPNNPMTDRSPFEPYTRRTRRFSTETIGNLDSFGSGVASFLGLSQMMLQYYNYGGEPGKMTHSRSFGIILDSGRGKALAGARKLEQLMSKEMGDSRPEGNFPILPPCVLLNLEIAESLRYSDQFYDRTSALKLYWRVSLLSELATEMIRQGH